MKDAINPTHYKSHPSGVECIRITEHMGFCLGNAVKYIWRADLKNNAIEDLEKAKWYIQCEIDKRGRDANKTPISAGSLSESFDRIRRGNADKLAEPPPLRPSRELS